MWTILVIPKRRVASVSPFLCNFYLSCFMLVFVHLLEASRMSCTWGAFI